MIRSLIVLAVLCPVLAAHAAERLAGPVPAQILRVVDGDTVEVEARIWLGQTVRTLVRILGADTPERRGRCARERELAHQARAFVAERLHGPVELHDIGRDKYGGRVTARVVDGQGVDITLALLGAGLARPYGGDTKTGWCGR